MGSEQGGRREPAGAAVLQETVTGAISEAMFDELADKGYARMTIDAVARRARVGKAAVYRRWRGKGPMVIDLVGAVAREYAPDVPDAGSLEADVRAFLDLVVEQVGDARARRIVLDMVTEATRDPELGEALRTAVAVPRRAAAGAIISRAIERGEIRGEADREIALDLIVSPLLFRLLLSDAPAADTYRAALARAIAAGLAGL